MSSYTVRKAVEDEIEIGELVRIKATGEVFVFGDGEYRCNWTSGITDINGNYWGSHNLSKLEVVDKLGKVLRLWERE